MPHAVSQEARAPALPWPQRDALAAARIVQDITKIGMLLISLASVPMLMSSWHWIKA